MAWTKTNDGLTLALFGAVRPRFVFVQSSRQWPIRCFEAGLVTELRLTKARYPADRSPDRLIRDLTAQSPRFAALWESGDIASRHDPARRKQIDHPSVGRISLDCDTLVVAGDDLRVMIYTAEPATEDAERLALAIVLGTQSLV